jgi:hypothetical protein
MATPQTDHRRSTDDSSGGYWLEREVWIGREGEGGRRWKPIQAAEGCF